METELYYLQSRYYDPQVGRFINADSYSSTGQEITGNNMFAYCGNNPVSRRDTGGNWWDTVLDLISLGSSIADVINNPDDPLAWLGLVGDIVDVAVPLVSGLGEVTRVATTTLEIIDDVHDAEKALDASLETVEAVSTGWKVGDDITDLTRAGNTPSWTTVQQRYWKNEAHYNPSLYSDADLSRMTKGRAPQIEYNGKMYSKELHHIEPRRNGGSNSYDNLLQVWPWEHAEIDPFRHFKP